MSQAKNKVYTFLKMIKDPINAKTPEGAYYHAHNLRFITSSNEINGGFHYEKGNKLFLEFPRPSINAANKRIEYGINYYGANASVTSVETRYLHYKLDLDIPVTPNMPRNEIEKQYLEEGTIYRMSEVQVPLGWCITTDGIVIITTDNNGFDCVWLVQHVNETFEIALLYMRNMGLSVDHPIEMINNYETEKVDKIYWLDGVHQLRHLNLKQSVKNGDDNDLIDSSVLLIEALSQAELPQPTIQDISYGGSHTAGVIQYAYILYKMNGSQTMLSPVSEMVALGRGIQSGGGDVNEIVGASPVVNIKGIDTIYDNIMVYAIKYTSYYGVPSVTIIADQSIPDNGELTVYDNGISLATSSIEEIKLINNSLNFPGSLSSKDNSLFLANYKENNFKVNLDVRAYQFPKNTTPQTSSTTLVYDNIYEETDGQINGTSKFITSTGANAFTDDPNDKFSSINLDYDVNSYRPNSAVRGGEGKYLHFELVRGSGVDPTKKYLKDREIYRLAIVFYNKFGQTTRPMWIADFKSGDGNLRGAPNMFRFGFKQSFFNWLEEQDLDEYTRPVGYKLLMAERTNSDKTILVSGLITSTIITNNQAFNRPYHETYDSGKRIRVKASDVEEVDSILRSKPKSPTPAFRNSWIDPNNTIHEILFNGGANTFGGNIVSGQIDAMKTRLIDSPLQKASHHRNLTSTLIEGIDTVDIKYLTEFPLSKDKPNRFWNFQDSKLMQLYSPEVLFNMVPTLPEDCDFHVRYAYRNTENYNWLRAIDTTGGGILFEWKIKNRLSTQINVDLNTNINAPEYIMPSGDTPYADMVMNHNSTQNSVGLPAPNQVRVFLQGWARSGMFSNFWGDVWGSVSTITPTQLFYRRYGNKVETMVPLQFSDFDIENGGGIGGGNIGTYPNNTGHVILPDVPLDIPVGLSSYQGGISANIQATPELMDTLPDAESIVVTTTIQPLTSTAKNRSVMTINSGLNGSENVDFVLNSSSFLPITTVVTLTNSMLEAYPTIQNSIEIQSEEDDSLETSINYAVDISVYNSSNQIIYNSAINNVVNYSQFTELQITNVPPDILVPGNSVSHKIYGKPEYTKRGQSTKAYNGDGYFKYNNTLRNIGGNDLGGTNNDVDKAIRGINSEGSPCITFVLNPEAKVDNKDAISFEDLMWESQFNSTIGTKNVGTIYGEIVRSKRDIYLGGIYGGNSYEDKRRTNYLEIGEYRKLDSSTQLITSPGDTFVQDFRFLRMSRGSVTKLTPSFSEIEEILEYPTETTVDLMNRNDDSFLQWDSDFSYLDTDYHKYNKVYSQPNLITTNRDLEYNFKIVDRFNATVRGSKKKINGEKIDSWLQPMVNESLDLDGKYGPIYKLINFNDSIFAMQERGISALAINPKIQYSEGTNNATLQLGTGRLLDDYKYISVTKGSMKWNCIATEDGIFFVDLFTKTMNVIDGQGVQEISLSQGFKLFSIDNIEYDKYKTDNPLISQGISMGYDPTRKDVYFTFADDINKMTLCYNIIQQGFSSFYDYHGTMYIPYKGELFIPDPNNQTRLYQSFAGDYNVFYEQNQESSIEFIVQPEPHVECTFNNLEYKDEASNSNQTEVVKTFEKIRVTNEFQDSGEIDLKPKFNIRKLNRKWRLNIPRDNNKVNRIRNNWAKIRLSNQNLERLNHKVDDIILYYNPNYKIFR